MNRVGQNVHRFFYQRVQNSAGYKIPRNTVVDDITRVETILIHHDIMTERIMVKNESSRLTQRKNFIVMQYYQLNQKWTILHQSWTNKQGTGKH